LALIAILGVLPLIVGLWLIVIARKKGLGYPACGQCQYDLSGTLDTSTTCPECGSDVKQVGVLAPKPASNKVAMTLGILLLCVPLTCVGVGLISAFVARMRLDEAQQAATAVQMQAVQQNNAAIIMTSPADPAAVDGFRQKHASLTLDEAGHQLGVVGQALVQAVNDGDLEKAKSLRAEQQALIELLTELGKAPPP